MKLSPLDIRIALENWVSTYQPHSEGDVLVGEMCFLGKKRRADLVHANGKLSAYEIKSEADSLSRWPGQEEAYLKVFDHVWLCCHTKHIEKSFKKIQPDTGLLVVDDFLNVAVVKNAHYNFKTDPYSLTSLLHRVELDELCKMHGLTTKSWEPIRIIRERVADNILRESIQVFVLACVKIRFRSQGAKAPC